MGTKKASTFPNMLLALVLITVVAGASLGFINKLTEGPKALAKLQKKNLALEAVLPAFDNDPLEFVKRVKMAESPDSLEIYTALLGNEPSGGAVVSTSQKGYNGTIRLMVGFTPDGTINNIVVLEQKETPGLGTKMKDEAFIDQFRGKNPSSFNLKVKKDQGEVDALTGATITTRAFSEAVQQAYEGYIKQPPRQ